MAVVAQWLVRALVASAPYLVGYFVNDVGDGISNITGTKDDQGRTPNWLRAVVFVGLTAVILATLNFFAKGKAKR